MTTAAKLLFTGKTHVTSGPDGAAHADGLLDIKLAAAAPGRREPFRRRLVGLLPRRARPRRRPAQGQAAGRASVDTAIDLNNANGDFFLRARLDVSVPGVDRSSHRN